MKKKSLKQQLHIVSKKRKKGISFGSFDKQIAYQPWLFNISVSVMLIFSLSVRLISDIIFHEKVFSIKFWYDLCNRIPQTFVNVSSANKKKVHHRFLKNLQSPPFWNRSISFVFSCYCSQEQNLPADGEGNSIFIYIHWKYICYNLSWTHKLPRT